MTDLPATTSYSYRLDGLETSTTAAWLSPTPFTSTYFPNGLLDALTLANVSNIKRTYDASNREASLVATKSDNTALSSWTNIVYDEANNRIEETASQSQPTGGPKQGAGAYKYDPLNRLTSFTHPLDQSTKAYGLYDAPYIKPSVPCAPVLSDPNRCWALLQPTSDSSELENFLPYRPLARTFTPTDLIQATLTSSENKKRKTQYNYNPDGTLAEILEPRSFDPVSLSPLGQLQKVKYSLYPNNRLKAFADERCSPLTDAEQSSCSSIFYYTPKGLIQKEIEPEADVTASARLLSATFSVAYSEASLIQDMGSTHSFVIGAIDFATQFRGSASMEKADAMSCYGVGGVAVSTLSFYTAGVLGGGGLSARVAGHYDMAAQGASRVSFCRSQSVLKMDLTLSSSSSDSVCSGDEFVSKLLPK